MLLFVSYKAPSALWDFQCSLEGKDLVLLQEYPSVITVFPNPIRVAKSCKIV